MAFPEETKMLVAEYIQEGDHSDSDYFGLIKELVTLRNGYKRGSWEFTIWQEEIDGTYELIRDELINNQANPATLVKFGTSGWRGIIGKDLNVRSVSQVTQAIVSLYHEVENGSELAEALGVKSLEEARTE